MFSAVLVLALHQATLEVGPKKQYQRIEAAVAVAHPGDSILVYPDPHGYPKTAVRLRTASITIRGVDSKPIEVKGDGFEYSGSGSVPRAIIQFEPEAKGSSIKNLDLSGAHNESHNGAGIRIQSASNITVSDCVIHDNDMGVMSNGLEGDPTAASKQLIEYCLIERNGSQENAGYSHNLYLGGTSVKLDHCEIRNSLVGHNVKSRAHYIRIEGCYIHDSANREIDLPEAWDTSRINSNAVLIGNRIIKDPKCVGNRGVIHFGAEKGTRVGNIYLSSNTIVTPFFSPVVSITVPNTRIVAVMNTTINCDQASASWWESSAPGTIFEPTDNQFAIAYGSMKGNMTALHKSELFDRTPPSYLHNSGSGTGLGPMTTWIDGDGTTHMEIAPRIDLSLNVGPRPSR